MPKAQCSLFANSISDRKPLSDKLGIFQFIDQGNSIVIIADIAIPLFIKYRVVLTQAEFPGTRTWFDHDGRTEKGPIQFLFIPENIQRFSLFTGSMPPGFRKTGRIYQLHTRRYFQTSCSADYD